MAEYQVRVVFFRQLRKFKKELFAIRLKSMDQSRRPELVGSRLIRNMGG
jgi:hypothetical protein